MLLINGKKKLALDYANKEDLPAHRSKPIITKGRVTIENFNKSGSLMKSIMAKLNRKNLLEFMESCMYYQDNNLISRDCWKFVDDAIQFLERKGKVLEDRIKKFADQLNEIRRRNNKEYI